MHKKEQEFIDRERAHQTEYQKKCGELEQLKETMRTEVQKIVREYRSRTDGVVR